MKRLAIPFAAALMLAGCGGGEPEGQVAARVDGIEITEREVAGEAAAIGADVHEPGERARVIDRLIDRKLLARAARSALVDRTPAAQIDVRRAREDALARTYAQRIGAQAPPPDPAVIDRFIQANPHLYAARVTYVVDRLTVPQASARLIEGLGAEAAAAALDRRGIPYRRQLVLIDSDTQSARDSAALAARAVGATIGTRAGDTVNIDTLLIRRPVREPLDAQRTRARAAMVRANATAAIDAAIRALRVDAEIAVQDRRDAPPRP
jgi:hypothetical protein